jgi:hypothetical protein
MAVCTALYFTIALILDFKTLSFANDAGSRMANGFYVLYSRDPHLAAIGFVWNPLQSILDIGPLLFKDLWPALASHNVAGSIVSVLCMAGAVHQTRAALQEWGVSRAPRLVIAAVFALNPMILFYAANGMSEALYLFTLIATTRYLARWLRTDDLRSLVYSGAFLGLGYLARNEAVAAAGFSGILVLAVSFYRGTGGRRERTMRGMTDSVIFLMPVVTSFVGWAVASLVITSEAFAQFTSQYGTSAQIAAAGGSAPKLGAGVGLEVQALEYLAPLLPVLVIIALLVAWRRRDPLVLIPLSVVGGALLFDVVGYLSGSIIWSFRYFIASVPTEMLMVGVILAAVPKRTLAGTQWVSYRARTRGSRAPQGGGATSRPRPRLVSLLGVGVAAVVLVPSIPASAAGMFNPNVGVEELREVGYLFENPKTSADRADQQHFAAIMTLTNYIAGMHMPNGDVLVDNFTGCIPQVITSVPNPKVFVIPNDVDFQRVLADPLTFHTHYILLPPSSGLNVETATAKAYPTLYEDGAGFATMVHQFPAEGLCSAFRLYRVTGHPNEVGEQADTATATSG